MVVHAPGHLLYGRCRGCVATAALRRDTGPTDAMHDVSASSQIGYQAVAAQTSVRRRLRGLSDRALAWLFITPTIVLLLAINIFPLIWTIYLSFTSYRA